MGKRTYSQREKRQKTYVQQSCSAQDDGSKRRKTEDPDELHYPPSPPPSRGDKASSLLKKSLKVFGGPISIPEDEKEVDSAPKSKSRLPVFDKVLKERFHAMKPKPRTIHSSREDFEETIKSGETSKPNGTMSKTSHLPTPPADIQKMSHQEARRTHTLPKPGSSTVKHTPKPPVAPSQPSKVTKDSAPKQLFNPKPYHSPPHPFPRTNLFGFPISKKSPSSTLWTINQTNSPFLRLPPEIRNEIYARLLGGHTISIYHETYRETYPPNAPYNSAPLSVIPIFKYQSTISNQRANPFTPYQLDLRGVSTRFTLLNGICRQMYHETAVLPYRLNTLAFTSYNTLFNFLVAERRLARQQLNALTMLMLPDELPGGNVLGLLGGLEWVCLRAGARKGWYWVERRGDEAVPKLVERRGMGMGMGMGY